VYTEITEHTQSVIVTTFCG